MSAQHSQPMRATQQPTQGSKYTNQNNFGIIIANHGVKVTFTTGLISEFDTSDGDYDVYCIMYIDGKIFINMSVYSNI